MTKERIPYWQKLKDPRWQMKRLELMKARGLTCEHCKVEGKTLEIHHKVYRRNTDPWNYEDWAYSVLCEDCHKLAQELMEGAHDALARFPTLAAACSTIQQIPDKEHAENLSEVIGWATEHSSPMIEIIGGCISLRNHIVASTALRKEASNES